MSAQQKSVSSMETKKGHSWFCIQCEWEHEHDDDAIDKWKEVFKFLKRPPSGELPPLREEIADEGLIALNLIGQRKFLIVGQAKSNRPLQRISSMVTLRTAIKVNVFAATNVFEFGRINKDIIGDMDQVK